MAMLSVGPYIARRHTHSSDWETSETTAGSPGGKVKEIRGRLGQYGSILRLYNTNVVSLVALLLALSAFALLCFLCPVLFAISRG